MVKLCCISMSWVEELVEANQAVGLLLYESSAKWWSCDVRLFFNWSLCTWPVRKSGPRSVSWRRLALWSGSVHEPVDSRTLWVKRQLIQEHNPNAVCDKVARSQGLQCWSCIYASHRVSSSKWYGAQRDPSKEVCSEVSEMKQWTSTISSDALQRLCCGSEMFYSISCKLVVQESPNWQHEEALITQCWFWHLWDRSGHGSNRSSKLQVVSQQSVLMYHCWPSNCRKDDNRLSLIRSFHLTRACFFQSQHQGHQSTCRQSVMMSSTNLSAVMSAVMSSQFSCSVKQCAVPVVN